MRQDQIEEMNIEAFTRKITRRHIQIVLGVFWLLDGLLQLQHQMFTSSFITYVIDPTINSQPDYISSVAHVFTRLFLSSPVIFNLLIIVIQLSIGVLLIKRSTARYGVIASVIWGLFVWYVGEGLGGLATGQTLLLMGAPGSALLYSVIALGVIPNKPNKPNKAKDSTHPASWLAYAWAILWLGGAVLQLNGGQNTTKELSIMVAGMGSGAPTWLGSLDLHTAHLISRQGGWLIAVLVIVQALIGIGIFASKRLRVYAVACGAIVSLLFWVFGQGLGMFYSGLATDPNSAPLVILLGIAVLAAPAIKLGLT